MSEPHDLFTTKRTVNHRTKQIETRIQRQIVIEDGKVVSDTGPLVTTKTLEDTKQEIDEIQEKYDFTKSSNQGPYRPTNQECGEKDNSVPIKKFMFGYDAQQSAPINETSKNIKQEHRFQNQNADSKWNTPSKYFYFGQDTSNIIDIKEKENLHLNDTIDTLTEKSGKINPRKMSNGSNSTDEKDCQFVYEYSNFAKLDRN